MPENICCACISVGKSRSSRWWSSFVPYTVVLMLLTFPTCSAGTSEEGAHIDSSAEFYWAQVNLTYIDPQTKQQVHETTKGKYGTTSLAKPRTGLAVHVRNKDNKTHGCDEYAVKIPKEKWIALVERGHCYFTDKINQATKTYNASAVVIYNNEDDGITIMQHSVKDQVSIFVSQETGRMLAELADQGVRVMMTITPGKKDMVSAGPHNSISKTSILFVSISFIVLMIISLAWLVFYYIQRFRYAHAKERLARRLASAAKKAIAKIPQKTVKNGDRELDSEFDQCAVCIETYKPHEVIRTLPCKHVFHKSCVDPWLLDQRSCPMCKLDILRAYGMQVFGSQESVHQDAESGNVAAAAEDHSHSSTTDDQPNADTEVKVLLLPHTCLHFHSHSSAVVSGSASDGASASAAVGASSASTSSSTSSSDDRTPHHPLPCLVRSSASAERLSRGAGGVSGGGNSSCGRNDLERQALMSGSGDEEEEDVVVARKEEEEEGLHEHPTPPCRVHRGRGSEDCAGEGPRNLGDGGGDGGGGDFCLVVQLPPQCRDGEKDSGEC